MIAAPLLLFMLQDATGYDSKARQIYEKIGTERLKLAADLQRKGLGAWARWEFAKVLFRNSSNEKAKAGLSTQAINKIKPGEGRKPAEEYRKELDRIAAMAAKLHLELAEWCDKNGLQENGRAHRLEALACEPANATAAAGVGFRTSALMPLPSDPETVELFRVFRDDPAKAAAADVAAWAPDALKKILKVATVAHVGAESTWMGDDWLRELARWGDHSYAIAHKLLGIDPPKDEPRYWFAYLDDATYESQTAWINEGQPKASYAFLLKLAWWRNDAEGFRVARKRFDHQPKEDMAHLVPQFVMTRRFWPDQTDVDRAALQEGFGILCEFIGANTSLVWCIGTPSTGGKGKGRSYRDFAASVAYDMTDTPTDALWRAKFESIQSGSAAAKAASLQEWLFARGRKDAAAFLKAIATSKDPAATIRQSYGWCPEEFDEFWRRWAVAIWQTTPTAKPPELGDEDEKLGPPDK